MISIIIPVYNEETNLRTILPLLMGKPSIKEVLVCDGGSTDASVEVASSLGIEVIQCDKKSRAYQLNIGAARAEGEILVFLHADVIPPANFETYIYNAINEGYPMGWFSYQFDKSSFLLKFNERATRSDHTFAGGGDQMIFIKKETFVHIGGFDESFVIMEDFDFVRRVKKNNISRKVILKPCTVSSRKYINNSWWKVNYVNLKCFILFLLKTSPANIKSYYQRKLTSI